MRSSAILCFLWLLLTAARASGSSMFSWTVSDGRRLKNWKTTPMFFKRNSDSWLSFNFVTSLPNSFTIPESGVWRRLRIFISVDLPTPDFPRIKMKSPCLTLRLTSFSTSVSP